MAERCTGSKNESQLVEVESMPLELLPDAGGDPRNANFLAVACDLAYFPQAVGAPRFQAELGLAATLIAVDNTQAYVLGNDQHLVVAFRGSEDPTTIDGLKDWFLTNAMNLLILPEGRLGARLLRCRGGDTVSPRVRLGDYGNLGSALCRGGSPVESQRSNALGHRAQPRWSARTIGIVALPSQDDSGSSDLYVRRSNGGQ